MNKKIYIRILIITFLLAIFDVAAFSEGIFNLKLFGAGLKNTLLSAGIIFANIGILFSMFKFYTTSTEAKYGYNMDKLKNTIDYKEALESCKRKNSPFIDEINRAITDVLSIEKKQKVLHEILEQSDKSNYTALIDLGIESKTYIFNNIRKILNRISIADAGEWSGSVEDHKAYISAILANNDKILVEFGKFLTEVSRMDDPSEFVDITNVLGDMVGSLKQLRGEDDEVERKFKNL